MVELAPGGVDRPARGGGFKVVAASIGLLPVGAVAIAGPTQARDGDSQAASSRGPPLV